MITKTIKITTARLTRTAAIAPITISLFPNVGGDEVVTMEMFITWEFEKKKSEDILLAKRQYSKILEIVIPSVLLVVNDELSVLGSEDETVIAKDVVTIVEVCVVSWVATGVCSEK